MFNKTVFISFNTILPILLQYWFVTKLGVSSETDIAYFSLSVVQYISAVINVVGGNDIYNKIAKYSEIGEKKYIIDIKRESIVSIVVFIILIIIYATTRTLSLYDVLLSCLYSGSVVVTYKYTINIATLISVKKEKESEAIQSLFIIIYGLIVMLAADFSKLRIELLLILPIYFKAISNEFCVVYYTRKIIKVEKIKSDYMLNKEISVSTMLTKSEGVLERLIVKEAGSGYLTFYSLTAMGISLFVNILNRIFLLPNYINGKEFSPNIRIIKKINFNILIIIVISLLLTALAVSEIKIGGYRSNELRHFMIYGLIMSLIMVQSQGIVYSLYSQGKTSKLAYVSVVVFFVGILIKYYSIDYGMPLFLIACIFVSLIELIFQFKLKEMK